MPNDEESASGADNRLPEIPAMTIETFHHLLLRCLGETDVRQKIFEVVADRIRKGERLPRL